MNSEGFSIDLPAPKRLRACMHAGPQVWQLGKDIVFGTTVAIEALGTGFKNGVKFSDFEILNDEQGRPIINFCGKAREIISKNQNIKPHVTISNERIYAVALVTLISF